RILWARDPNELCQRRLAPSVWSHQADGCAIGNQSRHDCGWADELGRTVVAEDGVVTIVAFRNQVFSRFVFGEQAEPIAEVPAAGTLAQVAAERCHVAYLGAGGFVRGFG